MAVPYRAQPANTVGLCWFHLAKRPLSVCWSNKTVCQSYFCEGLQWFFKYFCMLLWFYPVLFLFTLISKDTTLVSLISSSSTYTHVSEFYIVNYSKWCFICSSYYSFFYNKDNVRITYNFSFALYGSHPVCRGHLHLLLLLSSWCAKPETTLCEWRVQTQQVESDYNKHFSLLPQPPTPNTGVLLEQAFTSASTPALLDLRPLTSFKIRAPPACLYSAGRGLSSACHFVRKTSSREGSGSGLIKKKTYFKLIKLLKL